MENCSISLSGVLAYEPQQDRTQDGNPRLILTLKVSTRGNATRWIKVKAYGLLADHAAESFHEGDCVTVRADDLDSWGKVDNRPADGRGRGNAPDDGPRVLTRVYVTAYDISLSCRHDTAASGQTIRRAAQSGESQAEETGLSAGERADLRVLDGVRA